MHQRDIETCAQLGVTLSVQPTHLVADRDLADTHWGDTRTGRAYAFRSMLDADCEVLLGSDAPIEDLHPLAALYAATQRDGGAHGLPPARTPWHAEQRIPPESALRACTSAPADATTPGRKLGRLTPGYHADLVVLSGDPLVESIADIEVVATMVGGRWTYGAAAL
jgi:predicted amidohydrolase YtcJ